MRGHTNASPQVSFVWYNSQFGNILGPQPQVLLLADASDTNEALFHEACVYDPKTNSVFVTSNQLPNPEHDPDKQIRLFRIWDKTSPSTEPTSDDLDDDSTTAEIEELASPQIAAAMLNGGVNFTSTSILFCAQGTRDLDDPSGLVILQIPPGTSPSPSSPSSTPEPLILQPLLKTFYGIPFNSVNDVVVHPKDGTIWFTDPCYGYHQGIRPRSRLPNQVYRYNPKDKSIRAVAADFLRPNGLCFSPDLETLYVTDTGAVHGDPDVPFDPTGPSHIWAFDLVYNRHRHSDTEDPPTPVELSLTNRRLFAFAPGGAPDGIKCDTNGNVYSGCGDGIEVWNEDGLPLGVIKIEGGVANFCFGKGGVVYVCNETRMWKVGLNEKVVRGALLGV